MSTTTSGGSSRNGLDLCTRTCSCASGSVSQDALGQCVAYPKVQAALQKHFGHDNFRPGQLEAILPVVHGKDAFVLMPTGGGKPLCTFLVPLSISDAAMGIVVSPLNALMDEHVRRSLCLCADEACN